MFDHSGGPFRLAGQIRLVRALDHVNASRIPIEGVLKLRIDSSRRTDQPVGGHATELHADFNQLTAARILPSPNVDARPGRHPVARISDTEVTDQRQDYVVNMPVNSIRIG